MPERGWYLDPDLTPGRYRYWDGVSWTTQTTRTPGSADVPERDPALRRTRVSRRGRAVTIGVLAMLLLMTLGGTVAVVGSRANQDADGPLPPRASQSVYDDRSPTPTSTTPSTAGPGQPVDCRQERPDQLSAPAADGRVHGGPLSFTALGSPWTRAQPSGRFPLSRDSSVQTLKLPEVLPWQASVQVGLVAFDVFPGGPVAAEAMLTCLLTSDFYSSVDVTVARSTGSDVKISGVAATRLDATVTFSHPELKTRGSDIRIIVVDTLPVTYYFHAVPVERTDLIGVLDRATRSLSTT